MWQPKALLEELQRRKPLQELLHSAPLQSLLPRITNRLGVLSWRYLQITASLARAYHNPHQWHRPSILATGLLQVPIMAS